MSSDIAALAEHVKQRNASRESRRALAQVQKKPASAEAKLTAPKQEEVESDGGTRERGRSRERRRSTPEPGSSTGASSSSAMDQSKVWTLVDGEEDPPARDDKVWDPITAEEERWLELEASDMVKSEETSGLDTAMSKLKVSSEALQTASTGPENAAVPAGTTDAEEDAPLSARSVISSGSAFDEMRRSE